MTAQPKAPLTPTTPSPSEAHDRRLRERVLAALSTPAKPIPQETVEADAQAVIENARQSRGLGTA